MDKNLDVERRRSSAVVVAESALEKGESLHPAHLSELLSIAVWMYTEAEGKYTTQYATVASLNAGAKIRHEHVIPRLALRRAMLSAPHRVREILSLAVACTVTQEEHRILGNGFGWHRYEGATIQVVERRSRCAVDLATLANDLDLAWDAAVAS